MRHGLPYAPMICAMAAIAALAGCAGPLTAPAGFVAQPAVFISPPRRAEGGSLRGDEFGAGYLAWTIKDQLRHREVFDQPIVVTTFVDLNDLDKSSVFGRVLAEKLLTELHLAGFTVSEIRKGKDIFIRKDIGEMILSRDTREILGKSRARAVLAGTYVATEKSVIVNARLIDVSSPLILSSCSYNLPMTKELEKLLTGESPF